MMISTRLGESLFHYCKLVVIDCIARYYPLSSACLSLWVWRLAIAAAKIDSFLQQDESRQLSQQQTVELAMERLLLCI